MLTRRAFVHLALGGAALLRARRALGDDLPPSPPAVPFEQELRVPRVLRPVSTAGAADHYQIVMRPGLNQYLPGAATPILGYDGQFPGPTIIARRGRPVVVHQVNALDFNTSVHLHGSHTPASSDGFPDDYVRPGQSRDYFYPNDQEATLLWYHDHAMDFTGPNVYRGLAGAYVIRDEHEASLGLPSGEFEVPLILSDRRFNGDNSLAYAPFEHQGFLGDVVAVNGVVQPRLRVARRKYRFRLLNASNRRWYHLRLSQGSFVQIGGDGGLLPAPIVRDTVRVVPAERLDLVVDFSSCQPGTRVLLHNRSVDGPDEVRAEGRTGLLMAFDVGGAGPSAPDHSRVPATLRTLPPVDTSDVAVTRLWEFERSDGAWVINGQVFDPDRIDAQPKLGTTEIWVLKNGGGGWVHPIHIHLQQFRILDIDGSPPPPWDAGLKDMFALGPGQTMRVVARFLNYAGKYVFHCHNLEHEDMRMMGTFETVP